jgi:hypothetical protein
MPASLYVTTSRKPGRITRRVARTLALLLGARYENRGKRSLSEVAAQAAKHGLARILFLHEAKGNPSRLALWEGGWLSPELRIRSVRGGEGRPGQRLPGEARAEALDKDGEAFAALLDLPEPEGRRVVAMEASKTGLRFLLEGQEVLALQGELAAPAAPAGEA